MAGINVGLLSGSRVAVTVAGRTLTAALLARMLIVEGIDRAVARGAVEARDLVDSSDPDAALIDISLGAGSNGVDLAHVMSDQYPHVPLLLLTRFPDLCSAGLRGYELPAKCGFVRKDRVPDQGYLVDAIEQVLHDHAREVRDDVDLSQLLGNLTE